MMQHKAIKERHDQQQLMSKQGNKIKVKKRFGAALGEIQI